MDDYEEQHKDNNFKEKSKKIILSLIKNKFFKAKLILILVVVLIVAILLPAFIVLIKFDNGIYREGDMSNVPYAVSQYINSAKCGEDGITTDITAQEVWDSLIEAGSNIDEYLDNAEELEKLMNAEIITQFPKIGNGTAELDGKIEFERNTTEGGNSKLVYLNLETFNNYIYENNIDVMNHFTLDDEGNALVAVMDTTTETLTSNDSNMDISEYTDSLNDSNKSGDEYKKVDININSRAIPYKNGVSKYTMPFQYLWALLVIGKDKEFVLELADLVLEESEITISIYDNITTTVNTDVYTYKKQKKTDTFVKLTTGAETNNSSENLDKTEYKVTKEIVYETNNPNFELTKANVWIMDYSKEYTYKSKEETSSDTNAKSLEDTEYKEDIGSPEDSNVNSALLNNPIATSFLSSHRQRQQEILDAANEKKGTGEDLYSQEDYEGHASVSSINISYVRCNYYTRKISRVQTTTSIVLSQSYVAGNVISNPKVEKDKNQNNFVTILCSPKHTEAKKLLTRSGAEWLFEILKSNADTCNMVDLTKYLFYKVTGSDYGVTEYDFSVYDPSNMNQVNFSLGASYESLNLTESDLDILYKITSAERGGGTQQQQEYVVSVILNRVLSSKFPNTVHDVVFAPMQFQPTRNGAYEAAVPSSTTIAAVNNVVQNGDKAKCAVYFMTPAASLGQSWLSNCIFLFNDENDELRYTNTGGTHNFYTTQDVMNELQQYATVGNGSIVDSAIALHKFVRENGYKYSQAGVHVPNTSTKTIDCSSYVTWVLVNANVSGFTGGMYQWTSSTFAMNPLGWQEVTVEEAKPGDIVVYSEHVEIIAAIGSDKFIVYNCGGNSSINALGSADLPESSTSGKSKTTVQKILRVP